MYHTVYLYSTPTFFACQTLEAFVLCFIYMMGDFSKKTVYKVAEWLEDNGIEFKFCQVFKGMYEVFL